MVELEVCGDHFLMRHQDPQGNPTPSWAGGDLEYPENWLSENGRPESGDVDAGGLTPSTAGPFHTPPTKARGPSYWHMPLSPWILQRKKIRSESQNPFPRENRLSKSWYYWCWWKLRGACNLFNKSPTVFAGAPEFSCFLASILRGLEGPLWSTQMFDQLCVFSGQLRWSEGPQFSRVFLLKFFVSFGIHYKWHNYISFSSLIEHISYKSWLTTWMPAEAEQRPCAPAAVPFPSRMALHPMLSPPLARVSLQHVPGLGHWQIPTNPRGRKESLGQPKVEFQRTMESLQRIWDENLVGIYYSQASTFYPHMIATISYLETNI